MSLRIKLASLFIIVALSVLVIGLVNIQLMRGTTQEFSQLTDQNVPVFMALGHIQSSVMKIREEALTVLLLINETQQSQSSSTALDEKILAESEEIGAAYKEFTVWLERYSTLVTDPRREALVQQIQQAGRTSFETSQTIIALKKRGAQGEAIFDLRNTLEKSEENIDTLVNTAIDLEKAKFDTNRTEANNNAYLTYGINTISMLVGMGLAISTGLIISRTVAAPIAKLKEAAAAIGRGQLNTTVSLHSPDEFEFLGRAFNQMALDLSQTTVSKIYLDNIINSMGETLMVIDPDHTIRSVNQTTLELLHYTEPDLIGHPAQLVLTDKMMTKLFAQEKVRNAETTYLTKSGQKVPMLFSSSWLRDHEGQVQGVVCVAFDISERKKTVKALRQREGQLLEAQRVAKLGYWHLDLTNNQLQWSEQIYEIYGIPPQVEPSFDLILSKTPPEEAQQLQDIIRSTIKDGATMFCLEHRVIRPDGIGYISIIGHIVREPDGRPILNYGTSQDITQRKQFEIALQRSNEQLTAMYEIAQLISSTLDFEKLLDSIAESTAGLFNCEACTIRLLDKNSHLLNIVGAYGISREMMDQTKHKVGESIAGKTVLFNRPILIPDLPHNPEFANPAAMAEGLLSCAIVPLKQGANVIGTLDVHSKSKKNAFDQADLQLLERLAGQAAIAIENARLFKEEQHQRRLAESLREVAIALNSTIDHKALLDKIFTQLKSVLRFDGAGILLKVRQNLILIADTNETDADIGFVLPLASADPAVRVFNSQSPSIIADVHTDPGWEIWDGGERIRGWMGAPLLTNGQSIGVITADSFTVDSFQAEDAHILQIFASQAVVAINNAQLFQREQYQRQIAESLREISTVISSSLDQHYILEKIFEELNHVIYYDGAAIILLEKDMLEIKAGRNLPEHFIGNRIPLTSKNPTLKPFLTHQPVIIADVHQLSHWYDNMWKGGERIRSWMGVPLLVNEAPLGVLTLDNFTPNYYSEEDAALLQLFANQVAIAIQNARLYAIAQHEIIEHERVAKDLEQARDQALAASRLKSELLAKVSHELRTPLAAIMGYTELLQNGIFGPVSEQQTRIYQSVIDSAIYLTDMVNELLDQAQLESGKIRMTIDLFSPHELLDPVMAKMDVLAKAKNLRLIFEMDPALPANLSGDKKKLQQILVNLISNAVKFTPTGQIEVRLYAASPDHWAIQVSDTGPGIPQEAQNYIFEPFRQLDGSSTRQHAGSGLGLSIVKQMVALMEGTIDLTSEINQGSTFIITLPFIRSEEKIT